MHERPNKSKRNISRRFVLYLRSYTQFPRTEIENSVRRFVNFIFFFLSSTFFVDNSRPGQLCMPNPHRILYYIIMLNVYIIILYDIIPRESTNTRISIFSQLEHVIKRIRSKRQQQHVSIKFTWICTFFLFHYIYFITLSTAITSGFYRLHPHPRSIRRFYIILRYNKKFLIVQFVDFLIEES